MELGCLHALDLLGVDQHQLPALHLDGDGRLELVCSMFNMYTTYFGGLAVMRSAAKDTYGVAWAGIQAGHSALVTDLADWDRDGRPEILALELERSGAGTLRVFFLTPAGPWNCRCRTDE